MKFFFLKSLWKKPKQWRVGKNQSFSSIQIIIIRHDDRYGWVLFLQKLNTWSVPYTYLCWKHLRVVCHGQVDLVSEVVSVSRLWYSFSVRDIEKKKRKLNRKGGELGKMKHGRPYSTTTMYGFHYSNSGIVRFRNPLEWEIWIRRFERFQRGSNIHTAIQANPVNI